jgi:hypothetical protein
MVAVTRGGGAEDMPPCCGCCGIDGRIGRGGGTGIEGRAGALPRSDGIGAAAGITGFTTCWDTGVGTGADAACCGTGASPTPRPAP